MTKKKIEEQDYIDAYALCNVLTLLLDNLLLNPAVKLNKEIKKQAQEALKTISKTKADLKI